MDRFIGKVAVVTGSSSGIGAALSKELVKRGVIVVGLARRMDKLKVHKSISITVAISSWTVIKMVIISTEFG